jgi:hypothetical protein
MSKQTETIHCPSGLVVKVRKLTSQDSRVFYNHKNAAITGELGVICPNCGFTYGFDIARADFFEKESVT